MKSMLYVGATLMIGASIYGFVDYKQTHNKKEFKDMYAEKKATAPTVVTKEEKTTMPEKKAPVAVKPVLSKKKTVVKSEEAEPVIAISDEDKMTTSLKKINEDALDKPEPAKETKVVKKKKVRKEFFSRGRMPEEEVLIEKPVKKEIKKTESKEL